MNKSVGLALSIALDLSASGCGTIQAWNGDRQAPHYFSGTRLNVATLTDNQDDLSEFRFHGVSPLPDPYPLLDVPTSLVADVLMLPVALCATIGDAIFPGDSSTVLSGCRP